MSLTRIGLAVLLAVAGASGARAEPPKDLSVAGAPDIVAPAVAPSWPPAKGARVGLTEDQLRLLEVKAEKLGAVRVILGLDVEFTHEGVLSSPETESQRLAIARAQYEVVSRLSDLGLGVELIADWYFIPFMALAVDAAALRELRNLRRVVSIEEDIAVPPLMASSNPVIGSPTAWAAGFTGAGQHVAVLDTGVDKTHPYFATLGKVVSEACYSTTFAPQGSTSVCPGGVSSSTAPGSGVNCSGTIAGCDHGTHVAGTVAGDDTIGPNFGVARGANIIAIQVFSRFTGANCGTGPDPCALTYTSDQISGIQRVTALAGTFDIASLNMSLGGGQFFATCDAGNASRKAAIDSARALDIAPAIAAGNDGYRDSMGAPGCISTAVSVGATDDADNVASFSNIAPFISLLAPGVSINSSVPGGGTANFQGTSMATPHVAGAWAVLKQKVPGLSVNDALAALQATGTDVDDLRSGGIETDMPRINVDLALASLCAPDSFEDDDVAAQAKGITPGVTKNHSICPVGDEDWSTFTLTADSEVTLATTGPSGDTRMWLREDDESLIEFDDDGGPALFSLIERTTCGTNSLPAGTYLVEVDEFGDNGEIASYDLDLTVTPCPCVPDAFEVDDTQGQATPISSGVTKTHNICPVGDDDWSTFTLAAESDVTLATTGPTGDTRMWLRDSGGSQIEFNDDGGPGLFSLITRVCGTDPLAAGTYFVEIDEFGDNQEIATYNLDLTASVCGPPPCPADLVLASQTLTGTQHHNATNSVTLGNALVSNGTDIQVHAPTVLFLGDVEVGGAFVAGNTPTCP